MSIKINILCNEANVRFKRQLPEYLKLEGFEFYENSLLEIVWDVVVMFEGAAFSYNVRCKKGGFVFIAGEPPDGRKYAKRFLKQFDHLITTHSNIQHSNNHLSQPAIDWWYGRKNKPLSYKFQFDDLERMELPIKSKKISFITSNQSAMPGHIKRLKFLSVIKSTFGDQIDFFGRGFNQVEDKAEAILPYMFSISIENSCVPHYWTEKLADPILGFSVPVYFGCPNIDDYFQ